MKFFVIVLLSVTLLFSNAQTSSGSITGHVVDHSGAVIHSAIVRLVQQQTDIPSINLLL